MRFGKPRFLPCAVCGGRGTIMFCMGAVGRFSLGDTATGIIVMHEWTSAARNKAAKYRARAEADVAALGWRFTPDAFVRIC